MPWKERYTISDERSITDADIRWPGGNRCCFSITVDLSVAPGPDGIKPRADLARPRRNSAERWPRRDRGASDRFGFKATFAVPAVMAPRSGATSCAS